MEGDAPSTTGGLMMRGTLTAVRSEINVTPLVDVCLVLLIIFMMVGPLLRKGIQVALPDTPHPMSMPEVSHQLTLFIKSDGNIFLDQAWVRPQRLLPMLKAIHNSSPDRPVVVDGDRRLPYEDVALVLQMVRDAGFDRVGLATVRRPSEQAPIGAAVVDR
jgi:biopolymer transport protein TolR